MSLPAAAEAPIFLIGFMGSGKTTVGGLLAERLGWSFYDLDELISSKAGLAVHQIFALEGEPAFRQRETAALRSIAAEPRSVVATGGGAACREENLELMLSSGRVVALSVSAREALRRTGRRSGRPLIDSIADPLAAAEGLLRARRRFYLRAPVRVVTNGQTPEMVVTTILNRLEVGA